MKDLSQDILNKIKDEHIHPVPKWHFVLHTSVIWALFVFCVLLGGLAVSSIIFHVNDVDLDVYGRMSDNMFSFVMMVIPYFWVVLMGLFVFAAYYNLKHTNGGYKYGTTLILLASVVGSLLIGLLVYYADANESLEENVMRKLPLYNMMMPPKEMLWNEPERGLLTGTIMDIMNRNELHLQGISGAPWVVDYGHAVWQRGLKPMPGVRVKILGVKDDDDHFTASEIRPWFRNPLRMQTTIQIVKFPPNNNLKEN